MKSLLSTCRFIIILLIGLPGGLSAQPPSEAPLGLPKLAHTYSIVAYDPATGDLGVAVQSKFPNVGGIIPWAKAGVGARAVMKIPRLGSLLPLHRIFIPGGEAWLHDN